MKLLLSITLLAMFQFTSFSSSHKFSKEHKTNTTELNSDYILAQISGNKPANDVFAKCLQGYNKIKKLAGSDWNNNLITIIDFRLPSKEKRLWVIDLVQKKVIFNTLVAHGKNSGAEFATHFSNKPSSHQSSLGFYLTGTTYQGKHGLSLYLDGLEKGINDNAKARAVVMHGADYVSKDFIRRNGRLGRSFGCPSIPTEVSKEIINTIKDKTCLFIYYPDQSYESASKLLNSVSTL